MVVHTRKENFVPTGYLRLNIMTGNTGSSEASSLGLKLALDVAFMSSLCVSTAGAQYVARGAFRNAGSLVNIAVAMSPMPRLPKPANFEYLKVLVRIWAQSRNYVAMRQSAQKRLTLEQYLIGAGLA